MSTSILDFVFGLKYFIIFNPFIFISLEFFHRFSVVSIFISVENAVHISSVCFEVDMEPLAIWYTSLAAAKV